MEKLLAIDIVLLIPKHIQEMCNLLNRYSDSSKYVSFNDEYQPHLSLAMAYVKHDDLPKIDEAIKNTLKNFTVQSLAIQDLRQSRITYGFGVTKTPEIVALHQACMIAIQPYVHLIEGLPDMFAEPEHINQKTIEWVDRYQPKHQDVNQFDPHITLGVGNPESTLSFPVPLLSNTVALFQLGPYCTCKNKLQEYTLT